MILRGGQVVNRRVSGSCVRSFWRYIPITQNPQKVSTFLWMRWPHVWVRALKYTTTHRMFHTKCLTCVNRSSRRRGEETYLWHRERAGVSDAGEQNGQKSVRLAREIAALKDPRGARADGPRAGLPSADGPERRKQPASRTAHAKHARYDTHTLLSKFALCLISLMSSRTNRGF